MTQSMTGFARSSVSMETFSVTVECRSVNHRYIDIQFRMPDNLRELEGAMRAVISKKISRGKLDVHIRTTDTASERALTVNTSRVESLRVALVEIGSLFPEAEMPNRLSLLLAPGVMVEHEIDAEKLKQASLACLEECADNLLVQRLREGKKLAAIVTERCNQTRVLLQQLQERLPSLQDAHRAKINRRLTELDKEADPVRLEEEIVYMLQRSDAAEEMDRMQAHLDAIEQAVGDAKPCGRRLDFLMQELNREANTLGSKSTALSTSNTSVEFKVLIEQMREQIQNIE